MSNNNPQSTPMNKTNRELRDTIQAIYNQSVMMSRLRTGSPINFLTDEILALIKTEKQTLLDELVGKAVTYTERIESGNEYIDTHVVPVEAIKEVKEGL